MKRTQFSQLPIIGAYLVHGPSLLTFIAMLIGLTILMLFASDHSSLYAQGERPDVTAGATPPPAGSAPQAEGLTPQVYLPLVTLGNVAQGANLDFDAPDFDGAVDNSDLEVDAPLFDESIDHHPATLLPMRAAAAGGISTIDSSEDYRALGYPDARKIVRNSSGYLYTAYRKKLSGRYRIYVAESVDNGATWQVLGAAPVESVGAYTQRVPALAIDAEDRLHLVWYGNDAANGNPENTSNEREIKYSRSSPTTGNTITWTPWRNLYDGQGYDGQGLWQEHPTITVSGASIYVVWESVERGLGEIRFIGSADGGTTWSAVVTIQPSAQLYFSRPTLQVSNVNGQPVLFVVAYGSKAGVARLYWSRSDDGGQHWRSWRSVIANTNDQRHASLAVDDQGRIHIVWRQVANGRTILRYRLYDPAKRLGQGGWVGSAQTIAAVRRACLFFPSITVSGDGTRWVVWTQSADCNSVPNDDPKGGQIMVTTAPAAGTTWQRPSALTANSAHLYGSLRRALTPAADGGNVDLVWLDASASPTDEAGNLTCSGNSCVLRHMMLAPW